MCDVGNAKTLEAFIHFQCQFYQILTYIIKFVLLLYHFCVHVMLIISQFIVDLRPRRLILPLQKEIKPLSNYQTLLKYISSMATQNCLIPCLVIVPSLIYKFNVYTKNLI